MSNLYPTYDKKWRGHNTNLTSVFNALKHYAYRPFSGNQRVNTIDPRTYYYLRHWLQQEKQAGHDAIQDTDEVRIWFDKGVMMPFNVNNIDVTVCANFIFGVTNGIINGLFQPSLLDDPEIMQIYNDTSRMIAFQVQTNFSDRADLALTYYPSVIEFYWFVARTYNKLQETLDRTGSLPHKGMEQVLVDFKLDFKLRTYASPRVVAQGHSGSHDGYDVIYYDDFIGNVDKTYENQSVNNAEDRIFTTSRALNALLTIMTTQDQNTEKVIWDRARLVWTHNDFDPGYFRNGMHSPFNSEDVNGSATVVPDPDGGSNLVLKVFYQKGRYSHHGPNSKVQFFATPTKPRDAMTLSYDIRFDSNFDFRIGGKLPGLYGGLTNCSGGRHSMSCFSTRFMWRDNGDGEVYGYVPDRAHQLPGFCTRNICDPVKGVSFGRGSWRFQRGVWQNIAQSIQLNTPGNTDGEIKVWHDGKLVYSIHNLALRSQSDVNIDGIFFSTFFGGSNATWAPTRDCYTWFKNFAILFDTDPQIVVG